MHRRRGFLTARKRCGFAPLALAAPAWALAAAACLLVSGCSPGVDYPSIFPAIHDMPPPRADTPMNSDQVQQATEDLVTERNHLNAQSQGGAQATNSTNPPGNAAAKPSAAKPSAAKSQSATAGGANGATTGTTVAPAVAGAQTAGTETK